MRKGSCHAMPGYAWRCDARGDCNPGRRWHGEVGTLKVCPTASCAADAAVLEAFAPALPMALSMVSSSNRSNSTSCTLPSSLRASMPSSFAVARKSSPFAFVRQPALTRNPASSACFKMRLPKRPVAPAMNTTLSLAEPRLDTFAVPVKVAESWLPTLANCVPSLAKGLLLPEPDFAAATTLTRRDALDLLVAADAALNGAARVCARMLLSNRVDPSKPEHQRTRGQHTATLLQKGPIMLMLSKLVAPGSLLSPPDLCDSRRDSLAKATARGRCGVPGSLRSTGKPSLEVVSL